MRRVPLSSIWTKSCLDLTRYAPLQAGGGGCLLRTPTASHRRPLEFIELRLDLTGFSQFYRVVAASAEEEKRGQNLSELWPEVNQ